jgi:hypothetical protein
VKPPPVPRGGRYDLRPDDRGGYVYDGPHFTATIAPDGAVVFKARPQGGPAFNLVPPLPTNRETALNKDNYKRATPYLRKSPLGTPNVQFLTPPPAPPRGRNARESCHARGLDDDCDDLETQPITVSGSFDAVEEMIPTLAKDDRRQEKAELLSATSAFRVSLAARFTQRALRSALRALPATLESLWSDPRYTPRERRLIVSQLLAECDGSPQGREAAKIIAAFLRGR